MQSQTSQHLDQLAFKKQMAVHLLGSHESYQNYKRTQQLSKVLYQNDLLIYNDTCQKRHERNISQVNKLISLIKQHKISPDMLLYNTLNTFYPSYIIHHHFQIYMKILMTNLENESVLKIYLQGLKLNKIGAYLEKKMSSQFGKVSNSNTKVQLLQNGSLQMDETLYFYQKNSSLYMHYCIIQVQSKNQKLYAVINIRNKSGNIEKGIKIKDFGLTISQDYLQIGYHFNGVKPFFVFKINKPSQINLITSKKYFHQFNLSLLDLHKSVYLTLKYTKLREQFKTLDGSKNQRPIIQYQAVASRIIDGFARLYCFSQINKALFNNSQIISFIGPLLDSTHHQILNRCISLRQCCGGFGYLQVSGHPGCIQRTALRSSDAQTCQIPQHPQILKRLHYYSSSDDMEQFFSKKITKDNAFNPGMVFAMFVNICVNMRKQNVNFKKQIYLRQFVIQSSIQNLKTSDQFSRLPKTSIPSLVLNYEASNYILTHGNFINWSYFQEHFSKQDYLRGILNFKNDYLNLLVQQLGAIQEILEVDFLRNTIVGREDKQEFYKEVFTSSKNNLRNSEQFRSFVRKPIVEMLAENNARL